MMDKSYRSYKSKASKAAASGSGDKSDNVLSGDKSFARDSDGSRFLRDTFAQSKISSASWMDEDRVVAAEMLVDFALSSKTLDISMKVRGQLESLNQFLDLLRMRLSIQEDFTMGAIVTMFDKTKKGFITINDVKKADAFSSLEQLDNDVLNYIFSPTSPNSPTASNSNEIRDKVDYQTFVRMFLP